MSDVPANHTTSSNDECRMSNAEGMTTHECSDESDDSFWFEERTPFIREEPDARHRFTIWRKERRDSVKRSLISPRRFRSGQ
jgi:hypothetical protein